MGIFRRSPSPAVPAHAATAASPSLDGASSSSISNTSSDHAYKHHLHVDGAYTPNTSAVVSSSSSPTLQPHAVDQHQQTQSRSRSRSPLFNDTASTSTQQQQIQPQRARSPALLTPIHYEQASNSSSPIGHAYSTGTTPMPSPQPGNMNNSNSANATSPWAGYLQEGQLAGASSESSSSSSSSKARSKNKKDLSLTPNSSSGSSNSSATHSSGRDDSSTRAMAESRSVELKRLQLLNEEDESSRKSKALDLARFSVNGMLNLVEQRMMMMMMMMEEEQSQQQTRQEHVAPTRFANRAHGLGLSVSAGRSAPGSSATHRTNKHSPPSSRHMHTVGEEAESEEVLSSTTSTTNNHRTQQEGRPRTISAASSDTTTQLRDEVVDLLQLARKASSSSGSCITASTSSAASSSSAVASSSARGLSSDSQSYTSRSSGSSNTLRQMHDTQHMTAKYAPGTASREELENLARAISPFPLPSTSSTSSKPKKKFGGLFGGGSSKKNATSKEESRIRRSPSPLPFLALEATAISRSQSPLPTMETSPAATVLPQSSTQVSAGARRALHPPIAGAQRALVSAQHRRKRSMSVGDAVPFAILQSARQAASLSTQHNARNGTRGQQQQSHRLARPDVYDESYFSSSKMPYYHHLQSTSLNEKKRSNQLGRLGISEDDLEVDVQVRHDEHESLQGAKERLLAQSRDVVGHPVASSSNSKKTETRQRREGPHVGKVDEAQYAMYHQDTKSDEVPSASASLSSMATSSASSASSSSATSKDTATKRRGQLVVHDDTTGQYKLRNDSSSSAQGQPQVNVTSWTTPSQPAPSKTDNKTRINRSNSDASFVDPFLPRANSSGGADTHPTSASNVRRPAQLAVPLHTTNMKHLAHTHTQDSVKAIGPPPASPLPSPPRTSSSLPSSRVPSPSHQVGLAPAPSPAPTSPLPPLPAAICSPPTKHNGLPLPPTRPPPAAPLPLPAPSSSAANTAQKGEKDTKYDFELRPHRTKQQGRAKLSPLTERNRSPPLLETPALDRHTLGPPRLFGTKGIVQRPPSALDMTLLPSPSPSPSASIIPAPISTTIQPSSSTSSSSSSSASLSGSISSGSMITPKAREFNRDQIRRREETSTTVASQYSTEGDFESYDSSRSIASASASSAAMVERVHSSGSASSSSSSSSISGNSSSAAGHTTLSNTTSYSSSSMSSYVTRPSLSMDGHSTSSCSDDYSSVSTHDQQGLDSYRDLRVISPYDHPHHEHPQQKHQKPAYTYTHVNEAVPMKPPRNMSKMTPSPSCESVNNLAGIGLAGASSNVVFPHSRRMHFGWSRHKAVRDLSSHAEIEGNDNDGEDYDIEQVRIGNGMTSPASPGSEDDDAYAGILSDYAKTMKLAKDDEGYMGSSPEMTSPTTSTTAKVLSRSHGNSSARQKITLDRPTVKQARSF